MPGNEKAAYLIYGPESSGNRMMARALIAAGCIGDGDHYQRWEEQPLDGDPIVWLRSIPNGGQWPSIDMQCRHLQAYGYEPVFLVMVRDWTATSRSQVLRGHVKTELEGLANIQRAMRFIMGGVRSWPFQIVNYDAIVSRGWDAICPILETLGLDPPPPEKRFEIIDANAKHYEQQTS